MPYNLDVNGAARILHWHPMTIYSKARKGEIPCEHIGSAVRFDKAQILEFREQYDAAQEAKRTVKQQSGPSS